MNLENYELLHVSPDATDEEIKESYRALKKKYNEDRWLDGEAGNEAARMLGRLDTAYEEIMKERRESRRDSGGASNAYEEVASLIRNGNIPEAQRKLDEFNERGAEWHYLQSVIFYKKNWINESKKQLEIALQMDPSNSKYRDAYEKLCARVDYQSQSGGASHMYADPAAGGEQMGGNFCANCASFCYTFLCVNCLFNLCCNCR